MTRQMTPEESADAGSRAAGYISDVIDASMQVPGLSQVHWWGGFLASIAGMCLKHLGPAAHDIILSVTQSALKNSGKPGKGKKTLQ